MVEQQFSPVRRMLSGALAETKPAVQDFQRRLNQDPKPDGVVCGDGAYAVDERGNAACK